jgi:hypothetical protein
MKIGGGNGSGPALRMLVQLSTEISERTRCGRNSFDVEWSGSIATAQIRNTSQQFKRLIPSDRGHD